MNELPEIDDLRVKAELKKVLDSNTFKRASRQLELLTYLVKQTLAGEQPDEPTIAKEVFHIENFAADKLGTVRETAKALRTSLAKYYITEGRADPVWILLPRGKYIPDFEDHSPPALRPGDRRHRHRTHRRQPPRGRRPWPTRRHAPSIGGAVRPRSA